jgi:hypothetical protein
LVANSDARRVDPAIVSAERSAAAHTSWRNTTDRKARAMPGQAGLRARFEREVDPDRKATPEQRAQMVESAVKAHFAKLRAASLRARQAKAARRG